MMSLAGSLADCVLADSFLIPPHPPLGFIQDFLFGGEELLGILDHTHFFRYFVQVCY